MKIDREEKRSLKKLLVGILVAAMVVTMLPVGDVGSIVAKAENTSELQSIEIFAKAEVVLIDDISSEQLESYPELEGMTNEDGSVSAETFFAYQLSKVTEETPVILKLTKDLDLIDIEAKFEGVESGTVGIDIGTFNFCTTDLYFGAYETNFYFYGDGGIIASYIENIEGEDGELTIESFNQYIDNTYGFLNFSGNINLTGIEFRVEDGGNLIINDEDLSVSAATTEIRPVRYYKQGELHYYKESQEMTLYKMLGEDFYITTDNGVVHDIEKFSPQESSQAPFDIYEQGAISSEVSILYGEEIYKNYNDIADVIEVTGTGLFHTTEVEDTIVLDAVSPEASVYAEAIQSSEATINAFVITDSYVEGLWSLGYEKVVVDDGVIPQSDEIINGISGIESVIVGNGQGEASVEQDNLRLTLDFAIKDRSLNFYNFSDSSIIVPEGSDIWVPWMGVYGDGDVINYTVELPDIKSDGPYGGEYVRPGDEIVITPNEEGMCIYNISWGTNILADSEVIKYTTDGSVVLTVPEYAPDGMIAFSVGTMTPEQSSSANINLPAPTFVDSKTQEDCYSEPFVVSAIERYVIWDVNSEDGWSTDGVTVSTEGTQTTRYYVMDVSMVEQVIENNETELVPSNTYGKRYYYDHTYTLDLATPTITSVTATDANGEVVPIEGGWLPNDENASVSAEMVWTNSPSVTLNATADRGDGLPVAEYKFVRAVGDDADGEWQTSNTYTYTGDGTYDVIIHAKDQFDLKIESVIGTRDEAGMWVTTFGIDTTAPKLMFTDGKNATASELKSNAQYEGNLHVVCDDGEGSGFASINLYKKNGSEWTLSNELLIATEDASFIAPTTQNEVYKLEVTDIAGNTNVYENITVVGYEQDVEITTGATTAIYGDVFEIEVTVKNISENPLDISKFELREDATDDVFEMDANTVTELAAGQSFTTKIRLPKGTNAGSYNAMFDMEYTNMDEDEGQHVSKVYSHQVVATIDKADAQGTVSVEDMVYGETVNVTVSSDTHGTEGITVSYKKADAEDVTYVAEAPTDAGDYKVKVVFAETTNYKELVVEKEFTIEKANAKGTVAVEDIVYGEKVNVVVSSDTHVTEDIIVYYKAADAEDSAYATAVPVNAGAYKVKVVFEETANYKELVVETEFTIEKAEGSASVTVDDFYYGQTPTTTVASTTNGTENVTIYYKKADADDTTYVTDVPRQTGTYKVKAVFPENANYKEVVAEDEFVITRISETRGMYSISLPNEDGIYEGPIVITGRDGNLVSVSEQSGFKEQIVINGSVGFFRFFIKTPDGAITEAVILRNIVIKVPPVKVTIGRAHLDSGEAYEFGAGTWNVSGDSTNYAGGIVFYVPASGEYEFTQQGGGQ